VPNLPIYEEAATAMKELIEKRALPYTDVGGDFRVRQAAAEFINNIYQRANDTNLPAFEAKYVRSVRVYPWSVLSCDITVTSW